jgi:hypothetical protein
VQLRPLDLLEQHCRNERQPMLGDEREAGDKIGFSREKVKRRTRPIAAVDGHDELLNA